jgi:hypothetical protein
MFAEEIVSPNATTAAVIIRRKLNRNDMLLQFLEVVDTVVVVATSVQPGAT